VPNPFLFVAVFLALVGVFHGILCVTHDRIKPLYWVWVEYLWLLGAALGLLGAGLKLRRVTLQADAQASRGALTNEWNQTRITARRALDILSTPIPECIGRTTPPSEECHALLAWYQYAANALDLGVETQRWRNFLFQNADIDPIELAKPLGASRIPQMPSWDFSEFPKTSSKDAKAFAQDLLTTMRTLNTHLDEVRAMEEGARYHWYDLLTRWVVPLYLTLALALKVTKNGADYLKFRNDTIAPEAGEIKPATQAERPIV
jgi:hypothetical protein